MSGFIFSQLIMDMFVNMHDISLLSCPFKRYQKIQLSVKKVVNKPRKKELNNIKVFSLTPQHKLNQNHHDCNIWVSS